MERRSNSIQRLLKNYQRAGLLPTPTPIYKLPRVSAHIGRDITIMRDDLTGFGIGGNKVRKLDFLIGDAVAKGANTLITTNASNFSRNAAAAGSAFDFETHVVVAGAAADQNRASEALFALFGAHLHYTPGGDPGAVKNEYENCLRALIDEGKSVYELHRGGSDPIGALGYVSAFDEIVQYSKTSGVHFDKIIHATGSTATQAGLILGRRISGYDTAIIGMAASQKADVQRARVLELTWSTAQMLAIDFDEADVIVEDGFLGPGYAKPSKEGRKAAELFGRMEGVLLDDVYTAKAAAGIIAYAANGKFGDNENILFIHTGGNAGQYY